MDDTLSNSHEKIVNEIAQQLGVSADIHPADFILQFLLNHPSFWPSNKAIKHDFNDGLASAQKLQAILRDDCGFVGKDRISLLEFASGYGCVTRHLKNVVPFCATTACDIHEEAVRFIEQQLQTDAILSTTRPEDLRLEQAFDVVFALSFFSHMPKNTFTRWLRKLASFVKSGGYLIFTTHGLVSRKYLFPDSRLDKDGFYFYRASDQKDISTNEYGTSCTTPKYVFVEALKIPELSPTHFREAYWWGHQDLYVFKKTVGLI
ncbi:MAG: class I SAM-dependent methyltransferase [Desulfatiglandales bacterium]